jgi:hypothetical protein
MVGSHWIDGVDDMKPPRAGDETADVMITVKTYPNPSETYGETVCVAGVRLDRERPEWIRLYPVKFRNADFDNQFKKYEIIRVNGTYAQDAGSLSFDPVQFLSLPAVSFSGLDGVKSHLQV